MDIQPTIHYRRIPWFAAAFLALALIGIAASNARCGHNEWHDEKHGELSVRWVAWERVQIIAGNVAPDGWYQLIVNVK